MKFRSDKTIFFLSLLALAFAYGFISHSKKVFPYSFLKQAQIGYQALREVRSDQSEPGVSFWDSELTAPQATTFSEEAGRENILFVGNEHAHLDIYPETGCLAWIMDRQGRILHAWKNDPDLWAPLEGRDALGDAWSAYPVGAHLFPNGDLLVSYHGRNVFPMSMGLAKFDKDSNLIWKRTGYYHHWFSIDDKGRIYVPSMDVVESPFHLEDSKKYFDCKDERFDVSTIEILDPDGRLLKKIDLLKAFADSDLGGILVNDGRIREDVKTCDPLHLNQVEVLPGGLSKDFSDFSPGDLLLSFRSLNGVGVLSPETGLFKWFYVGAVQNQHSPKFLGENRIAVFDNWGGRESLGTSRVVAVDVSSERTETVFPRPGVEFPSRLFFSETGGHIDLHPDRRRMLVSWTRQGLVWEVDMETGRVLWEYVNTHPVEDGFGRLTAHTSMYAGDLDFPLNGGNEP